MRPSFLLVAAAFSINGCSDEDSGTERRPSSGASGDAGADVDATAPAPDPKDGRDEDPASCFAVCGNSTFTCQAGSAITYASVTPDGTGCTGALLLDKGGAGEKEVPLVLDCGAKTVCVGEAPGAPATTCASGSFSAVSFSWTPSGGAESVCIRD